MTTVRDDGATTFVVQGTTSAPVSDDGATTCGACGASFVAQGRQRYCSTRCRQSAWRSKRAAPAEPVVAKPDTVYACPSCDARYLGEQRCEDCNGWCTKVGPGGACPECDAAVAISDLFRPDQLAPRPARTRRVSTST